MWMNEYEIDEAVVRYRSHPVLGKAARVLSALRHTINENSDGWPYWKAPSKAAKQLMSLFEKPAEATEAAYRKALAPIKSFCTRHKRVLDIPRAEAG